ncbi:MAG: Hpt domain-containing protein [Bacteriovorax sp.]|nr:Hpt domain-containing protein [Bacteriovorax sp.]
MNDEDKEFLESLRKDFIEEASDLLLKCEESLLNYEKNFEESYFQEYMRVLHSMKGSSRAVEFDSFASTIHQIESLGQKSKDQQFVEKSLNSIDGLKASLDMIRNENTDESENILKGILEKLK